MSDDAISTEDATAVTETVTMVGWVAKGALFVVIGLLGLRIAFRGYSADDADQSGALSAIVEAPAGQLLVLGVSIGLVLFAVWQAWSAFTHDIEWTELGSSADAFLDVCRAVGGVGLSVVYGLLAVTGFEAALSGTTGGSGEGGATSPEGISSSLIGWPGGRVAIVAIGVGTVAVGLYHLQKGIRRDFLDDISLDGLSDRQITLFTVLGVAGFTARALMLGIAGALFVVAALQRDPNEAAGLDQALRTLAEVGPGRIALGVAAAGLVAAGVYDMITFRRQRLGD